MVAPVNAKSGDILLAWCQDVDVGIQTLTCTWRFSDQRANSVDLPNDYNWTVRFLAVLSGVPNTVRVHFRPNYTTLPGPGVNLTGFAYPVVITAADIAAPYAKCVPEMMGAVYDTGGRMQLYEDGAGPYGPLTIQALMLGTIPGTIS